MIETIERDQILENVQTVGKYFKTCLDELAKVQPEVVEVRGLGLMIGLELSSAVIAKAVVNSLMARGIILNRTSETVLRFLPPYILEKKHVDIALKALSEVLTQVCAAPAWSEGKGEFHE